jgi:hypothetical protein
MKSQNGKENAKVNEWKEFEAQVNVDTYWKLEKERKPIFDKIRGKSNFAKKRFTKTE